jgi:acyl-[acyl carrier protein]--UDP-N-acetylglucosamine O-acyltransferase
MIRKEIVLEEIYGVKKDAYHTLFMLKILLKDALAKIEQSASVICMREIVKFIKNSKRGIVRSV